jgi:hypothetical protein
MVKTRFLVSNVSAGSVTLCRGHGVICPALKDYYHSFIYALVFTVVSSVFWAEVLLHFSLSCVLHILLISFSSI